MRERSLFTAGSTRRIGRMTTLVVAAGFAATLLGTDAAHACDRSPCIGATPNPVQLSSTATQGPSTVDWKGPRRSTVWLSVDGGGETSFANTNVGQKGLQILLGKSYRFRLYRTGPGSKVLASVTVTAKRPRSITMRRVGDTTVKRLIEAQVVPFGTYAEINATALEPRNITVFIANNRPTTCGGDGLDIVTVGAQGSKNYQTKFNFKVYNLEPSRDYYYLVKMVTPKGAATCTNGAIRTKRRQLDVWVRDIRIIDDSDANSSGDLSFKFFLNPRRQAGYPQRSARFPADGTRRSMDSGTTVDVKPDAKLSASGPPGVVEFNATGTDIDGVLAGVNFTLDGPLDGHDDDSRTDASGKTVKLYLDPQAPGQEYFVKDFNVRAVGGNLEFEAHCRMRVSYQ